MWSRVQNFRRRSSSNDRHGMLAINVSRWFAWYTTWCDDNTSILLKYIFPSHDIFFYKFKSNIKLFLRKISRYNFFKFRYQNKFLRNLKDFWIVYIIIDFIVEIEFVQINCRDDSLLIRRVSKSRFDCYYNFVAPLGYYHLIVSIIVDVVFAIIVTSSPRGKFASVNSISSCMPHAMYSCVESTNG